jgi:phage shock protein A
MANISHKITKVEDKLNSIYQQIEAAEQEAKNNLRKSQESKGSAKEMYKQRALIALKKKKQF